MIIWIKRILMLLGLYFVLMKLGLWGIVVDWLKEMPSMIVAAVIK